VVELVNNQVIMRAAEGVENGRELKELSSLGSYWGIVVCGWSKRTGMRVDPGPDDVGAS
jgi:hypothetical protein